MKAFDVLYSFYDTYNGADFYGFYKFYNEAVLKFGKLSPEIVLDLGCGTGELSKLLSKKYQVIGVDISPDMLSVASSKCQNKVLLLNQDMRSLELYGTIQGCVSFCDCFNYMENISDLKMTFSKIALFMEEGGLLVFDASTEYRFSKILNGTSFVNESEEGMLIHQSEYFASENALNMDITIFQKQGDKYIRFDERQKEYFYSEKKFTEIAEEVGFELCGIYGDINFGKASKNDEKHYYVFRRKKWEI